MFLKSLHQGHGKDDINKPLRHCQLETCDAPTIHVSWRRTPRSRVAQRSVQKVCEGGSRQLAGVTGDTWDWLHFQDRRIPDFTEIGPILTRRPEPVSSVLSSLIP